MKVNYQKIMNDIIAKNVAEGIRPKLLLHCCCAPCSSAVLERLNDFFDITLYFYNPNIYPESEYTFRMDELKRLISEMPVQRMDVVEPEYDNDKFESIAKGLEDIPEGGSRCLACYRLRLDKSISYAAENGFDYVTTTLSVSPHKNAGWLNEIGEELGKKYGIKYLVSDFKKQEGYKRSCTLSAEYNLYRQNYCGCIYSKKSALKKSMV